MKVNRYNWEYEFFFQKNLQCVYSYDFINKDLNSYNLDIDCKVVFNVDCNRSSDLIKNISYVTTLVGSKFSIKTFKKIENKKDKEKENKYRLCLSKRIDNSQPILYFYFYYLVKVFKDKKIFFSSKSKKNFYNVSLNNLNNSLKIGFALGLNEVDPRLTLNIVSKNVDLNYLTIMLLYDNNI